MRFVFFGLALLAAGSSCNNSSLVQSAADQKDSGKAAVKKDVLAVNMDPGVDPSQDFFLYANGGWIRNNPIPSDQGSWGIGNLVIEENLKRLRAISEKADAAHAAQGSVEQKIGDFWATAMDSVRIEQR